MLRISALSLLALLVSAWPDYSLAQQSEVAPISSPVIGDLGNKTIRFASDEFGAGIQYFGRDGRVFLWFPGQLKISNGKWSDGTFKLIGKPSSSGSGQEIISVSRVCFRFPGAPRATRTGKRFGPNECFQLDAIKAAIQEVADGDVLNLKSGKVPCRMCRPDKTLSQY